MNVKYTEDHAEEVKSASTQLEVIHVTADSGTNLTDLTVSI